MLTFRFLLALTIRLLIGALFVAAGVSKLVRLSSVRHVILGYRLLPATLVPTAALALAAGEIGCGGLLVLSGAPMMTSFFAGFATLGAALLLALFSFATGLALARGIAVPCGCSLALSGHVVTWAAFARNQALLLLLLGERLLRAGGNA